jgi:hypothetical protein
VEDKNLRNPQKRTEGRPAGRVRERKAAFREVAWGEHTRLGCGFSAAGRENWSGEPPDHAREPRAVPGESEVAGDYFIQAGPTSAAERGFHRGVALET